MLKIWPHWGRVGLCLLVLTIVASGHGHTVNSNHEAKSKEEVTSVDFSQDDTADAGDDAKMTDLTDSIQGMFGDDPVVPAEKATVPSKPTPAAAQKREITKPVASKVPQKPKIAKPVALKVTKAKAVKVAKAKVVKAVHPKVRRAKVVKKVTKPKAVKAAKAKVIKAVHPKVRRAKVVKKVTKAKVVKAAKAKVVKVVHPKVRHAKVVKKVPKVVHALAKKSSAKPVPAKKVSKKVIKALRSKHVATAIKPASRKVQKPIAEAHKKVKRTAVKSTVAVVIAKAKSSGKAKLATKPRQPKPIATAVAKLAAAVAKVDTKAVHALAKKSSAKPVLAKKVSKKVVRALRSKHVATAIKPAPHKVQKPITEAHKKVTRAAVKSTVAVVKQSLTKQIVAKAKGVGKAKLATKPKQPKPIATAVAKLAAAVAKAPMQKALKTMKKVNASMGHSKMNANLSSHTKVPSWGKIARTEKKIASKGKGKKVMQKPKMAQAVKTMSNRTLVDEVNRFNISSLFTNTTGNQTKAIEEAVVSLPMASFYVDAPVPNKTVHEFPGNASQKAAWEKREQYLEHEIKMLKGRLAHTSNTLNADKHPVPHSLPVLTKATGTFNAGHPEAAKENAAKSIGSTKNSVAGPVALHHVNTAGASLRKVVQGQKNSPTFAGAPAKKVTSALALHADVEQKTLFLGGERYEDSDSDTAGPPPELSEKAASVWGWFSSCVSWAFGSSSATGISAKSTARTPTLKASLIDISHPRSLMEDMARTEQATRDEGEHVIQVNDAWGQMEKEDNMKEDQVRREDRAARQLAETPAAPQVKHRHGADSSSFWGRLEKEDYGIEKSVDKDDMSEFQRLTDEQNDRLSKVALQVNNNKLPMNGHKIALKHNDDARMAVHEIWLKKERKDIAVEHKVHDSPDLQMLQLQHHHRRK